jgi:hypothetical protein
MARGLEAGQRAIAQRVADAVVAHLRSTGQLAGPHEAIEVERNEQGQIVAMTKSQLPLRGA